MNAAEVSAIPEGMTVKRERGAEDDEEKEAVAAAVVVVAAVAATVLCREAAVVVTGVDKCSMQQQHIYCGKTCERVDAELLIISQFSIFVFSGNLYCDKSKAPALIFNMMVG